MHIGWFCSHFDEEYTPSEEVWRDAKAPLSVIRPVASRRKTAPISAASCSPRPRTGTEPCSVTMARSALRCSVAQLAGSPVVATLSIGGLPDARSTSSSNAGDDNNISISFHLVLTTLGDSVKACST